jgi:hypothetical protein
MDVQEEGSTVRMQPIIVLALGALLLAVFLENRAQLAQQVVLTLGQAGLTASMRDLLLVAGAGWVLVWLAGLADVAAVDRRAARYRRALAQREDELARVKVHVYDREVPLLGQVESRLGAIEARLDALSRRSDPAVVIPERPREVVEELRR